ncbi:MAG: hypothetical protein JO215_11735 [Ktedonobacteraceae bacterium]|nr:hypothetical protein [Ktedonobacteraceae bacterium]
MAKALGGIGTVSGSSVQVQSMRAVWMLRMTLGFVALLGSIIFILGTSWDVQWHLLIGRDRTLIPPHLMMLSGVGLSGLAGLAAILIETFWARRDSLVARNSTGFADAFHGSLGAYVVGFAALNSAVAFPLDAYWHALYGIDVSLWAPFHVMIIMGMGIVALGSAYMLMSATNLALAAGGQSIVRVGYSGVVLAFAVVMCALTFFLIEAPSPNHFIHLGFITLSVFMFLPALLGSWTFVSVKTALPWRWSATTVVMIYYLFALIVNLFVPPATGVLMVTEGLSLRRSNPGVAILSFDWPLLPILAALVIDLVTRFAQKRNWSLKRLMLTEATLAMIGFIPLTLFNPAIFLRLPLRLGVAGFIVSLLLGWGGSLLGAWFGRRTGIDLQQVESPVMQQGEEA